MLNFSNDVKQIVCCFVFFVRLVSPQSGDTRGGPLPPPPLRDATAREEGASFFSRTTVTSNNIDNQGARAPSIQILLTI